MDDWESDLLFRRLNCLEQYVEKIGAICFQFMPPSGQEAMRHLQCSFHSAMDDVDKKANDERILKESE